MNKWFRLDNAAKVFPSVSNDKRPNVFRLAFELTEDVDPIILEEAANIATDRFKSLKVKLKRGLFWYYLDINNEKVIVREEDPNVCKSISKKDNNGHLFVVYYFKNRITLEIFHSLTDGTGGLELLKAITFTYLKLKGYDVESENLILSEIESTYEETQDSYLKNYDQKVKGAPRDVKALKFKGTEYGDYWVSLITGILDLEKTKEVAKSYNATITEFFCACLIMAAAKVPYMFKYKNRPFQITVPVNLRKMFPSRTLRNFSLVITTRSEIDKELVFSEVVDAVKEDFKFGLTKEYLHGQIVANVMLEKNIFLRLTPLFLKSLVLKIGFKAWGDLISSMSISNLGVIELPKSMHKYVENVFFSIGSSPSNPINIGASTYNNDLVVCFSSIFIERDFQKEFFRIISGFGIPTVIESNELEV